MLKDDNVKCKGAKLLGRLDQRQMKTWKDGS